MRARDVILPLCTALSLSMATGCSRTNPAYDGGLDGDLADDSVGGSMTSGAAEEESGLGEDESGGETGGSDPTGEDVDDGVGESGEPGEPGEDDGAAAEEDDLLLYSSLDSLEVVLSPEIGGGEGLLSEPLPEPIPGAEAMALRTTSGQQWFAFPQHDGEIANVDHAAGSLEMNLRVEFEAPHVQPRDLVSLAGVIPDGGGIRLGAAGLFDGNRLWVEYIDASGDTHRTRYPAGLLLADAWMHIELRWRADVGPDEPNVELWIDDEWIEPLPGYPTGPKQSGSASPEDVMIFGSWALGAGYGADASFDEIELRGG